MGCLTIPKFEQAPYNKSYISIWIASLSLIISKFQIKSNSINTFFSLSIELMQEYWSSKLIWESHRHGSIRVIWVSVLPSGISSTIGMNRSTKIQQVPALCTTAIRRPKGHHHLIELGCIHSWDAILKVAGVDLQFGNIWHYLLR